MPDPAIVSAYRRLAANYAADFPGYCRDVLQAKLTPQQLAVAAALSQPPYRVLVPAANGVGKTFLLGCLVNHHFDSFRPGISLVTSATDRSLKNQAFKEVRKLRPLGLDLLPQAPVLREDDTHQAIGFSTRQPDAFQGYHAEHFLLVYDEATGIPADIWDRGGTMWKGVPTHRWVCFYNPNDTTSPAFAAEQSGGWAVVRLSALDHPNVHAERRGEPPPFPNAVRLARVRERVRTECEPAGPDDPDHFFFDGTLWKPVSPAFNPQVRGLDPTTDTLAVWSPAAVASARAGGPEPGPDWPVQVGCDVAREGGDRTTIAVRRGVHLVHLEAHTAWPTARVGVHVGDRLRQLCDHYGTPRQPARAIPCLIDCTGGYGDTVTDHPKGYTLVPVNASQRASRADKYPNRRAELWYTLRLAADVEGFFCGRLPARAGTLLEELIQELQVAKALLDSHNRRTVLGKPAMRQALKRSPDLADAVCLAWYPPEFCG